MSSLGDSADSSQVAAHLPARAVSNESARAVGGNPAIGRVLRWALLAALLLLALVAAVREAPRELARWRMAAAVEHQRNGDLQASLAGMDSAIELDSRSADLFRRRSQFRLEAALLEENPDNERRALEASLADADRAIELAGEDPQYLLQRSLVLQHLGRHDEAVADWNVIVRIVGRQPFWLQMLNDSNEQLYSAYNGRAYARALGDIEHEEAMTEIEAALDHQPGDPMWLDTRGYLHWQQAERHARQAEKYAELAMGHSRNYESDEERRELEPHQEELTSELQLQEGELRRQASELRAAMIDFNAAVSGAEWQYAQWDVVVERDKWAITDPRLVARRRRELERSVAVIRYHRALVWQKLNADYYAERDLRRVRELGFEPGDDLF